MSTDNIEITEINASQVTLEVVDEKTGKVFRRTLPIDYRESYNGINLIGENLNGEPSEIVFFSEAGIAKMKDLSGQGADQPSCDGHSHDTPNT